jgi:hypothetical protein
MGFQSRDDPGEPASMEWFVIPPLPSQILCLVNRLGGTWT